MKQQIKKVRITKAEFHRLGGFDNPQLFRLQTRGGAWRYYKRVERIIVAVDPASPDGDMSVEVKRQGDKIISIRKVD